MRHLPWGHRAGLFMSLLVALGITAGPIAWAHNQVVDTSPQAGEVVTSSPLQVSVTTLEPMLETGGVNAGFAITVTDEGGLHFGDGCVRVEGHTLSGIFDLGSSGTYTLTYQFVSADGHTVSEQYDFLFDAPAGHSPASGAASAPVCGEAVPEQIQAEPITEPAPEPRVEASGQASPETANPAINAPGMLTALVAALVAAVSLGALWWLARRRSFR